MSSPLIPRIIHQTWRTHEVPAAYRNWQASWQRLNPGYEYRLWSNRDIEQLIARDFPEWASLFHSYRKNICRIDLARYLILKKYGGIYADLDYECLRPQDPLLRIRPLVLGAEPASHAQLEMAVRAKLDTVVCNAWMASAPGHPFWDHLLAYLMTTAAEPDVLDATGPFAMTRALQRYANKDLAILRAELLYPVAKEPCWDGRINDLAFFEQATREAFGIHYWEGSWFRRDAGSQTLKMPSVRARLSRAPSSVPGSAPAQPAASATSAAQQPRVSCLTLSTGRPDRLRRTIDAFLQQTWRNAELLIVTAADPKPLALLRAEYTDPRLRWIDASTADTTTPTALLASAIAAAQGEYLAIWHEDELHDPERLQWQMKALLQTAARTCLLERRVIWRPATQQLYLSGQTAYANSLICASSAWPHALTHDGALAVALALQNQESTLLIDLPRLLVEVATDAAPSAALPPSVDFSGAAYGRMLHELSKRVDIEGCMAIEVEVKADVAATVTRSSAGVQRNAPKVLVLTPMKNTAQHLDRYFTLLQSLDHPPDRLSVAIMEGDSTDGTSAALQAWRSRLDGRFARVELHQHHTGFQPGSARWRKEVQRERRSIIAEARNRLLAASLRDEDWVLWLDADLVDYPRDLLQAMLATGRDIVAPLCVLPDGRVFDMNTFCFHPDRAAAERPDYLFDGIYQPPTATGRVYLDAFADQSLVALDGVGGTALLVRADLHRRGLNFPTYSHRGYIETEGLAAMARDMGIDCWGMPQLRIVHGDH